jgi:hypothetical protein
MITNMDTKISEIDENIWSTFNANLIQLSNPVGKLFFY